MQARKEGLEYFENVIEFDESDQQQDYQDSVQLALTKYATWANEKMNQPTKFEDEDLPFYRSKPLGDPDKQAKKDRFTKYFI